MQGLKEAVQGLKLTDTDAIIEQGRRAYRAGFEKRNNPLNLPSHRTLWERGYELEEKKFNEMLYRWKNL